MRSRLLTLPAALAGTVLVAVCWSSSGPSPTAPAPSGLVGAADAGALARRVGSVAQVVPAPRVVAPTVPAAAPVSSAAAPVRRVVRPRTAVESPVQRGGRILASLHYDWAALGYRIEFMPARDGYLGLSDPTRRLVQVYVSPRESDLVLAHSIAHELGHVLDYARASAERRASYLRIRGLPEGTRWFGCEGCNDFATPAGDWAEVFAAWLAGPGDFRSRLAAPPTAAQLRELIALFS